MVLAADDVRHPDGRAVLLLIAAVAIVSVTLVVWIRFGGTAPGPLPPIPENPSAVLSVGQRIVFAPGDLSAGDSLLCENQGVLVGAWVPKPGHIAQAQIVGSEGTATIVIHTRPDGVVVARC